jgi:hypothetical protein
MANENTKEVSIFQSKYNEFVDELEQTFPEYSSQCKKSKSLDESTRLQRFMTEVNSVHSFQSNSDVNTSKNPGIVLPEIVLTDDVWNTLSDQSRGAIWEYLRILSLCSFLESGFSDDSTPPTWMNDMMNEMKQKLESVDFENLLKKFMTFFKSTESSSGDEKDEETKGGLPNFENLFEKGFPKLPEKFLKGHLARLAQEIVKDITPEDLGIRPDMMEECEKDPSRAFNILFSTFTNDPTLIQRTISKIGKRLQQKIASGSIRPQEIAREAEELMKEFSSNSSFVEMMEGIKSAFGFEDMDLARKAGKESSARLSLVRDRLRKKLEKNKAATAASSSTPSPTTPSSTSSSKPNPSSSQKKGNNGKKK